MADPGELKIPAATRPAAEAIIAKQVRDLTKMDHGTAEFLRDDIIDASPLTWFIQVDGLIVDAGRIDQEPRHECLAGRA